MTEEKDTIIEFTFGLDAPDIEDAEKLKFSTNLLGELRNLDEVNSADRAENLSPEKGSKPAFETLLGVLTAEVSLKNLKSFLGFLEKRLPQDTPMKGTIKMGENEVTFEGKSSKLGDFENTALKLINAMKEEKKKKKN